MCVVAGSFSSSLTAVFLRLSSCPHTIPQEAALRRKERASAAGEELDASRSPPMPYGPSPARAAAWAELAALRRLLNADGTERAEGTGAKAAEGAPASAAVVATQPEEVTPARGLSARPGAGNVRLSAVPQPPKTPKDALVRAAMGVWMCDPITGEL